MKITIIVISALMLVLCFKRIEENNDSAGENYAEEEKDQEQNFNRAIRKAERQKELEDYQQNN